MKRCQIAIYLKSGDQKHKRSVDDEILPALAERLKRFVSLLGSRFTIRKLARGGEFVPAQTARVLTATQYPTPPNFPLSTGDPDIAPPLVQLAQGIDGRDAQNLHRWQRKRYQLFWGRKCRAGQGRSRLCQVPARRRFEIQRNRKIVMAAELVSHRVENQFP